MTRLASSLSRGLAVLSLVAGLSQALACSTVVEVKPEFPIDVSAKPPAKPIADLPAVPQPPPPRVRLEGTTTVWVDEALTFTEDGVLSPEHADIIEALAKWLAKHPEVTTLRVEAQSIGSGSKRAHKKRSAGLAQQIVDQLTTEGIEAGRLEAVGAGRSEDEARHVTLSVELAAATPEETK
ncbi:hypothetical protein PPSIR1_26688 [Plesiocystis pacifica SIR-1]|uniref:OmpA-like domain-containing protein n=1 Tax=Plesiocystis pacifica SIR-1 TaxID=391625 RepID=A6GAA3_9BACT|nr:OmpA family protein [Plesiocystis pacifica]EDM77205.1 hypothetical protein PPSIR1_26688 [Plesiocystis pacifica SIR-1]